MTRGYIVSDHTSFADPCDHWRADIYVLRLFHDANLHTLDNTLYVRWVMERRKQDFDFIEVP